MCGKNDNDINFLINASNIFHWWHWDENCGRHERLNPQRENELYLTGERIFESGNASTSRKCARWYRDQSSERTWSVSQTSPHAKI